MVPDADLVALPKAHLHLHLTGGMRHETLLDLAEKYAVHLPGRLVEEQPPGVRHLGWARFQRLYDLARAVVRTEEDVRRLVREIAADEAGAGSRWLELQVTPTGYAARLGDVVRATEVFCAAAAEATAATGVEVRLVVAANRTRPPWEAELLARLAVRMRERGVVGFGLSNDERVGRTAEFAKAFTIARRGGLVAVPHAGELRGPASVVEAVSILGASRLGHGVRAVEDPAVLRMLADREVACEVCPASNLALGVFASAGEVPLPRLELAGVPVVLAADDPLLFGAGLVEQYAAARDVHGYSRGDLARLARASFRHAAMPPEERDRRCAEVDAWERRD